MSAISSAIITEPDFEPDTLGHLGPFRPLAGTFDGGGGHDFHPSKNGNEAAAYLGHAVLAPIGPRTNGSQLLSALRNRTRIDRPDETEAFHNQVGSWLSVAATRPVTLTIAIPGGHVDIATGHDDADATHFDLVATRKSLTADDISSPCLDSAFQTTLFAMCVETAAHPGSRQQTTMSEGAVRDLPPEHIDRNRCVRTAAPFPNQTVR